MPSERNSPKTAIKKKNGHHIRNAHFRFLIVEQYLLPTLSRNKRFRSSQILAF